MLVTNLLACPTLPPPREKKELAARRCLSWYLRATARQPAQPEDAPLVLTIHPVVYLVEEVDARVGEAGRLVLLGVRVEGRVFGKRETTEGVLKSCLRCLLSVPLLLKSLEHLRQVRSDLVSL